MKFVNRSADWTPTIYSRLCEDHFKESDLVRHKNKTLLKSANVIPSERTELEISTIPASLLPKVDPPWKKPRVLNVFPDEIHEWREIDRIQDFKDLNAEKCPSEFTFKNMGDSVVYFRLVFVGGITIIKESICITSHLHVSW